MFVCDSELNGANGFVVFVASPFIVRPSAKYRELKEPDRLLEYWKHIILRANNLRQTQSKNFKF